MNTPALLPRSFQDTISYYKELRQAAHEFTEEEYKAHGVKLREISYKDTTDADQWSMRWPEAEKIKTWSWEKLYHDYHSNSGIKRFDCAVFTGGRLTALCYGVPSRGKLILKLHAIERAPLNNPLEGKALSILLFAADAYARLINANEMWICNPMNEKLTGLYERAGYTPHRNHKGEATHLTLRLQP